VTGVRKSGNKGGGEGVNLMRGVGSAPLTLFEINNAMENRKKGKGGQAPPKEHFQDMLNHKCGRPHGKFRNSFFLIITSRPTREIEIWRVPEKRKTCSRLAGLWG